jgi:DNA polymerase III subunit epsilon
MKRAVKFALATGALFAAAVSVAAAALALLASGLAPGEAAVARAVLEERAPSLAFLALIVFIACVGAVRWLFARYVAPLAALAEQTRIVAGANPGHRVAGAARGETAELAASIDRLGDAYRAQQAQLEARVAESGARLEEERNRLAALMSELSEGVLLCNRDGRILLYNEQARALFAPAAPAALAGQGPVGLGRSVFAFLDRDQVAHALDKIRYGLDRGTPAPVTTFFTTGGAGNLIRVRAAPFLAPEREIAGLVLTCEDATRAFGQEAQRRSLLQALATQVRQPAANVRAAAENLVHYPGMDVRDRERFAAIIATESRALSDTIDEALRKYADALTGALTLEPMRLSDLVRVAQARIGAAASSTASSATPVESLWVNVDSYAFAQILAALAGRLRDQGGVREVALRAAARGGFAELDLAWHGGALEGDAGRWDSIPIQVGSEQAPLGIRDVVERHGGELWHQAGAPGEPSFIRFLIPLAPPGPEAERRRPPPESRPEYYDFDLFRVADGAASLLAQPLAELSYTVFDTETTGVHPSAGDRIVSLGAVRIVNGRLLRQEAYEQLVDPQRPVPQESVRIHGLRAADLAGQPRLAEVLPAFHRFAEDTVLVGHNAAFDMRFLELAEGESGVRFTQPVLDTLLLSAVVHRTVHDHSLEAIAARLGVAVVGRHTALGDALVTSEIFLKLLPLLGEQGIVTLGQALDASRETYYARLQY